MTDPIKIQPDGLRKAASEFDDVAHTADNIRNTLQSVTAARGEPWGHDTSGNAFADGPKGYKAGRDNMFHTLTQLVQLIEGNATNLRDTAQIFENNEKTRTLPQQP
jgi:uncharacterized protein YukE